MAPSCTLSKNVLMIWIPEPPREKVVSDLKSQFPDLEIRWLNSWDHGKQQRRDATETDEQLWDGVTMLLTSWVPPPAHLLTSVRFVQLSSAGADKWAHHAVYKNQKVIFCTANGIHGGILGYGAIGRQVARVAKAIGMEVYAYTRTEKSTAESRKDDSYCVPGIEGDPDGLLPAKWFYGSSKESLNTFLDQNLDILVVSLPLTDATRGIISAEQFEILSKKKTFLCNIARGAHVDQPALIQALENGQIRGAALDVADPEPLPQDHPLWKAPNLLITPHVSWFTSDYYGRVLDVLKENLIKMDAGERLLNMMDRELNY
ncbi:D-isomer specific 2-hydroxyacid dehydrogenase [Xylariaceae sp. FL0255]|nr:D-isomer specific 2-hydroxyacid dehydrogenase [Xylariaceae sp. FL0255]